jgi:hypothetical protein
MIGFVSVFVALAHCVAAAIVSPAAGECQTIGSGILSTFIGVDSTLSAFTIIEWD